MNTLFIPILSLSVLVAGCVEVESPAVKNQVRNGKTGDCAGVDLVQFDVNDEVQREVAANHAAKSAKLGCDFDAFYND